MTKILFVTSGVLPVPATSGGGVEGIIETIIDNNEENKDYDITIVSSYTKEAEMEADRYSSTSVVFTTPDHKVNDVMRWPTKIGRRIIEKITHRHIWFNEYPKIIKRTKELLKSERFDKVIIINYGQMIIPLVPYIPKNTEKILYLHNDNFNQKTIWAEKILSSYDHIITISNFLKNQIKTVDLPNSVAVDTVHTGIFKQKVSNDVKILRDKLKIKDDEFLGIYIGRLHPLKGVQFALDALKYLPDNFKLLIVGGVFYSQNKQSLFLRNLKKESKKYKDRVIFTGYLDPSEIPRYIKASDAVIVPSIVQEALGLTAIEAQSYGMALICSDSGGIPETRTDDSSIMIQYDENFSKNIAKAEQFLQENPLRRKQMIKNGLEFSENFKLDDFYRKFVVTLGN